MKCLLVCDNLNDVTFLKCNKRFGKHIMKLAKLQELIPPNVTAN